MQASTTTRFIQPDVLSRISNLDLLARTVVEGFIAGLHRSPYKGFSVEFLSYRPYIPGDDPMHLDWKLYARTDRYYIKEFEDETNTSLNLLVDVSHSMGYSSRGITKYEYAFYLASSLAYLAIRQRDGAGLTLFDDRILEHIPPRSTRGHLHTLLTRMEQAELGAKTQVGKPLHELADRLHKRGFIVLISDLLDDSEAILDGLRHFRFEGHEVIVLHLLDPQEVHFDFKDAVEFEDMETGEKMLIVSESVKEAYLENVNRFLDTLKENCGLLGIDYSLITTDQPVDFALFNYLTARQRRG